MTAVSDESIDKSIEARINHLENYMEDNILLGDFERDQIDERLGKLKGGYCMIKAGGTSEVEI